MAIFRRSCGQAFSPSFAVVVQNRLGHGSEEISLPERAGPIVPWASISPRDLPRKAEAARRVDVLALLDWVV